MKIIGRLLLVTMTLHLLAPLPVLAQQTAEANIAQLREQIAKLEKIDLDPETSPDVRTLNREFLRERQTQLGALVRRRVAALRQYLVTMGDALSPGERQAVEESIRALDAEPRRAAPPAESASAPAVQPRAESPTHAAAPKPDATGEAAFTGSLLPAGAYFPESGNYLNAPAVMPRAPRQGDVELKAPAGGKTKDLDINTLAKPLEVPRPLEVENRTVVTVMVRKSPINKCVVATKREELAPEPNPLAQIIKVLFGLGTIALPKTDPDAPAPPPICSTPMVAAPNANAAEIEADLDALRASLEKNLDPNPAHGSSIIVTRSEYEKMADRVTNFASCKAPKVAANDKLITTVNDGKDTYDYENVCSDAATLTRAKARLDIDLMVLLKLGSGVVERELPVLESAEVRLAAIRKALTGGYRSSPGEINWMKSVNDRLDCLARHLEVLRKSREFLQTAKAQFESFYEQIHSYEPKDTYSTALIADSNAKVTGTVTCTNVFTKQPAFDPIPFTIKYQDAPRGTVTAGIIYSTLDKRQVGIQPIFAGKAVDGSDTFRLTFAETDRADGQIIPFTFYNYRFWGDRKFSLNASAGVGVNPNNGSNQVEFFFGGSVGYKNVFFELGGHAGRWQELGGGFVIGDAVSTAPPSVPIERRYTVRPAFGVSYKIPLP